MYCVCTFVLLTRLFSHIVLRIPLSVEATCTFFNKTWETKFHTHTKTKLNIFSFWTKSEEFQSDWMKDTKNVIWSIRSWSSFFILRMFAAYGSRVQVSPNSLLKNFLCLAACRYLFIGAFTDLRHATIGFVMSVLQFVYVSDSSWTNFHWKDFQEVL